MSPRSAKHCTWCGQFTRATAEPVPFRNVLGDPVAQGPLCPTCEAAVRDMAARNVLRAPSLSFLKSMRDEYGWPGGSR